MNDDEGLQTRRGCLRPKDDVVEEEDVNFVRVAALVRGAIRKLKALGCAMRDMKHTARILIPRSERMTQKNKTHTKTNSWKYIY